MFSINNFEYDCTKKCKNSEHGKSITYSLTKKSISNESLAGFIGKTCKNFSEILDNEGRSALHLASSVDRYEIAEWLINHGALINLKDKESGQTPLHRSIYYGCINIAILLMKYGASFEITDDDFKNPIQCCCTIKKFDKKSIQNELFVWGSNKNYNLGIGNEQGKIRPESLEIFREQNIFIRDVSISIFHSIFLTDNQEVYVVGHGKGGRLGIGSENTLVVPQKVNIPFRNPEEKVICVSASRNHSLILTDHGNIYSCGLNTQFQLGLKPPPEKLLTFKEVGGLSVLNGKKLNGVIARNYHSLAYSDSEIYVWGLNGGQFGKQEHEAILHPKQISIVDQKILLVDSSNSAIACYTASKMLYVIHKFKIKTYKSPGLDEITKISVTGGEFTSTKLTNPQTEEKLKILVLTKSSNLYIWYEDIAQYVRCVFSMTRHIPIEKFTWCAKKLLILSDGDIYMGSIVKLNFHDIEMGEYQDTYNKKDLCTSNKVKIDLKRVSGISKAVDVFCDFEGENFAVLLEYSRKHLNVPSWDDKLNDFKRLYNETHESDAVHDVIFKIGNRMFPAHRLIIYYRSRGLKEILEKNNEKIVSLNFDGLIPELFELMLRFIYSNEIVKKEELIKIQEDTKNKNVISNFRLYVEKFGIQDLLPSKQNSFLKEINVPAFNRKDFPELYDVTIKCDHNQVIKAHKCVLVSRLEYFHMMFMNSWAESKTINLTTVPIEYMEPIIDYLYSSDFNSFKTQKSSENFLFNMISICDQFFVEQLRKNLEILITERLSIRNCGEILEFACYYNCEILEKVCMEFICSNLSRVLENRTLEGLEPEILCRINKNYRNMFKTVDYRIIAPYADAIEDGILESFIHDFSVDLDFKNLELGLTKSKSKFKNKPNRRSDQRNCEKETMIFFSDLTIQEKVKNTSICEEEDKTQLEVKLWKKVDKKDFKKKPPVKINEILQNESKIKNQFINLNSIIKSPDLIEEAIFTSSPVKNQSPPETHNRTLFSLADVTPLKSGKMSQKQRKRLSSDTSCPVISQSPIIEQPPVIPNVWGSIVTSPTKPVDIPGNSRNTTRLNKSEINSPSSFTSPPESSLTSIIKNEKQQKVYYEKTKMKSLALTQMEETAIEELKKFYNVENVFDESIKVERRQKVTINFAVWQHQKC